LRSTLSNSGPPREAVFSARSKRVFVVSGKNPLTDPGGYASYGYVVGECLTQLGYEVDLLAFGERDEEVRTAAGRIRTFGSRTVPRRTEFFPFWCRRFAREIHAALGEAEQAVVHGVGPWSLAGVLAMRKNRRIKAVGSYFTTLRNEMFWLAKGVPINDYGLGPKARYQTAYLVVLLTLHPIERWALSRLDTVFVHYEYTRKLLERELGLRGRNLVMIPYAIDLQPKAALNMIPAAPADHPFEVLTVCRQEPRKGINYLLRAYRLLLDRGVTFHATVVGSGALLEAHRKMTRRLGLDGSVEFPGFVPDLSRCLESANAFVLPSVQEGSGSISLLEAMSYGLPVVVSACDGLPEDVQNGVSGLLVAPADPERLADALEALARDAGLRSRLGRSAKEVYRTRFQPAAMRDALRDQYARLFPGAKGSGD